MPLYPLIRIWYMSYTYLHMQRKISYKHRIRLLGTLLCQMSAGGSCNTFGAAHYIFIFVDSVDSSVIFYFDVKTLSESMK